MPEGLTEFLLEDKRCLVLRPPGEEPLACMFLCGVDREILPRLGQGLPLLLCACPGDWERDYTPWPAPPLPGRAPFRGGGRAHLGFLADRLLPYVEDRFPIRRERGARGLLGYSLGGLFAAWSLYQTDRFGLVGSLSGSLWYDGWLDYAAAHSPRPDTKAYLSLGRAEERGGGPRMGRVGECTRRTAELWEKQTGAVTLRYNRGGHFTGITNRWRKALEWAAGEALAP